MSSNFECINCANPINAGARVCPFCHMNPYSLSAAGPYTGIGGGAPPPGGRLELDTMTFCVLGAAVAPAVPVVGFALIGIGLIAEWFQRD